MSEDQNGAVSQGSEEGDAAPATPVPAAPLAPTGQETTVNSTVIASISPSSALGEWFCTHIQTPPISQDIDRYNKIAGLVQQLHNLLT